MEELRERSKECREGLQSGIGSLRAHIEREKELFYTKNAVTIERLIRERVIEGVRRKLPLVVRNFPFDLSSLY